MLEALEHQAVPTEYLVKMARFFLENNYFKFKDDVKKKIQEQQLSQSLLLLKRVY